MSALPSQESPAPEASASQRPNDPSPRGHDDLTPAASLTSIVVRRRKVSADAAAAEAIATEAVAEALAEAPIEAPIETPPAVAPSEAAQAEPPASPMAAAYAAVAEVEPEHFEPYHTEPDLDGPRPAEALMQHWDELRHGRARPRVAELDDVAIAGAWPNSFLLRVGGTPEQPRLEPARTFGGNGAGMHVDATAIDWMVALGREVARDGRPLHEVDELPTPAGDQEHGVVALPFGDPSGMVDHVLCHIYPRTGLPPGARRARSGGQLFGRR